MVDHEYCNNTVSNKDLILNNNREITLQQNYSERLMSELFCFAQCLPYTSEPYVDTQKPQSLCP